MQKTIETRVIDALKPHPRNAKIYGSEHDLYDEKLVDSLRAGIWPGEIQVTTSNVIISGHRRCEHAIFAEIEQAEVWVRTDLPENPETPEVLEALLQGNLQRNKTKEQQLREFELWLEVEKEQAKGRIEAAKTKNGPGEIHQGQKTGAARDLAAERVGFKSGSDAEKALKALKAADAAEATGDVEQIEKAKLVKRELNKSLGGAVRVAREQGLIAAPKAKVAAPAAEVTETQPTAPEPASEVTEQPEPASFKLTPPSAAPKPQRPTVPDNLKQAHQREQKRIRERWQPIAEHLRAAHDLIRAEKERLCREYAGAHGSLIMQRRWQQMAEIWAESGLLNHFAEITGEPEAVTLEGILSELERSSRMANSWIKSVAVYTGCKPDPTRHQPALPPQPERVG